jgi:hypothetical protein
MKRPAEIKSYPYAAYDVRADIPQKRLAGIGAVSVGFNDLEAAIDVLLPILLRTPRSRWEDLTSRIRSIEDKCDLIKHAVRDDWQFDDDIKRMIADTVGQVNEVRQHRDSVLHAKILDPHADVTPGQIKKGKPSEVLISQEALDWLNDLIGALRNEITTVLNLIYRLRLFDDYVRKHPRTLLSEAVGANVDPEREQHEQAVQASIHRLRDLQKQRLPLQRRPKSLEEFLKPKIRARAPGVERTDP